METTPEKTTCADCGEELFPEDLVIFDDKIVCIECSKDTVFWDICKACNGSGEGNYDGSICPICKGTGDVAYG